MKQDAEPLIAEMQGEIAVGVKVFSRTEKLSNLLKSVGEQDIQTVYIADDGEMTDEKARIYERDYPFDLRVFDLPYDAGLGAGRAHIVDHLSEDYLLIVDSDHELLSDVSRLRDQLEQNDSIGGIGGLLYENQRITGHCHDLFENGDLLVRDVKQKKPVQNVAGHPFISFDFIPNVALFRRECLEEYCWDSEYVIGKEHLDFYVGHLKGTTWEFGVCPTVLFGHYPGGDTTYVENRESYRKLMKSREYFLEKWGYDDIVLGFTEWNEPNLQQPSWRELATILTKKVLLSAPRPIQKTLMRARNRIRRRRRRTPI